MMDANAHVIRHWEDVVFENRNKSYGAYPLRKAYTRRLWTGAAVTLGVVALIFVIPFYGPERVGDRTLPQTRETVIELGREPFIEIPRQRVTPAARRVNAENRPVLVTREEVAERDAEDVQEVLTGTVETGEGDVGVPQGAGTAPISEPIAIPLPTVRDVAEEMPAYEGGVEAMMKFIRKKIRYPHSPRRQQIEGTVYVRFVVRGDGTVTDVEVLRGVHPDYDREAVRVISMLPAWKGGRHNGKPVPVRMVLPIKFSLEK